MDRTSLAVIADIHGNRWALEAVLQDIDSREIKQIVNLGDSLRGPLDPAGTADILIQRDIPSISGNDDRVILTPATDPTSSLIYVQQQLTPAHYTWLRALPTTLNPMSDVLACHGTPTSDDTYLVEQVTMTGVTLRADNAILTELAMLSASVVLCGHSHLPRATWLSNGTLIVNPGSVGLPAYTHDEPILHAMESGSPHARYAILHSTTQGWQVEHILVPYDWQAAAATAHNLHRPDWAYWLAYGRAVQ